MLLRKMARIRILIQIGANLWTRILIYIFGSTPQV